MKKLKIGCKFRGVVRDKDGNIVAVVEKEPDLILRNWLGYVKQILLSTNLVSGDNLTDVLNNVRTSITVTTPRMMLGSGTTAATRIDYKIETPLYTAPDIMTVGTVTLGSGDKVTLAIAGVHTFAAQTTVSEAGFCTVGGSATTYLTAFNFQMTRDVFTGVSVPIGGSFTGTWTLTIN